ncbi:hypothetical protein [Phenylobacterium ferrooxidans]|uniref:Helix-hairpin-helix domain-containing protein n=1 Tax=Phenylobacterium ferrooxidans TaxID=2982689 RepID=A0ABW6CMP0_9CAUL
MKPYAKEIVDMLVRYAVLAATAALMATQPALSQPQRAASPAPARAPARLNPNTATDAQLRAVPGVPAAMVATIARSRPFATMREFHARVGTGLNDTQRQALYSAVFVPINLNATTREEIMLIPGMTTRMAHEFEEYRPYADMNQFNKEIGKYVPPAEVARLASYVTVR